MASFEELYGRRCRSPIGWFEIREAELIGPELVHQAMDKVKIIKEWLKTSQSRQKSYRDVRRREFVFQESDRVAYKLELPLEMSLVHLVFHVSMLKKVVGDLSLIVPVETIEVNKELTYEEIPVIILDRRIGSITGETLAKVLEIHRIMNEFGTAGVRSNSGGHIGC
ncbi:uncharacterized protein [Nicotiana tomentosiformis]|uniref:uncharacterized protein n=1 Tax=Nicotiana tomentosiformis TaxID=4098 RepID=UPI00388CA726